MLDNVLELYLNGDTTVAPVRYTVKEIINAGYTGRNQAAVQAHIDELKAVGVPAPDKIPTYYTKAARLLTTDDGFYAVDEENTGECEYVLLIAEDGKIYVGVGSDHTDRALERTNIPKAKQMCPNFISRNIWNYEDVKANWDNMEMRSWIHGNRKTLLQETKLDAFMTPEDLMERVKALCGGKLEPGTVIFSGTVGGLIDGYPFSDNFEVELLNPANGEKLVCKYDIKLIKTYH